MSSSPDRVPDPAYLKVFKGDLLVLVSDELVPPGLPRPGTGALRVIPPPGVPAVPFVPLPAPAAPAPEAPAAKPPEKKN